jgi:hypothetical protein
VAKQQLLRILGFVSEQSSASITRTLDLRAVERNAGRSMQAR